MNDRIPSRPRRPDPALLAILVGTVIIAGLTFWRLQPEEHDRVAPVPQVPWRDLALARCQPGGAQAFLEAHPPPNPVAGHAAACAALAGDIARATRIMGRVGASERGRSLDVFFEVAHRAAKAGRERAMAPAMDLVLAHQPSHPHARYHAGMVAFGGGRIDASKRHLEVALRGAGLPRDHRQTAEKTLKAIANQQCTPSESGRTRPCRTMCGDGQESCRDGRWRGCTAPTPRALPPTWTVRGKVRDFRSDHPDFETRIVGSDRGVVLPRLGPNRKPVYAGAPTTSSTSTKANFDTWYNDAPGINAARDLDLDLNPSGDGLTYRFRSKAFFPVDGELLGSEGRAHNAHFTLEVHTKFAYRGGEVFTYFSDDDLWVYLNGQLVLDLGGLHQTQEGKVALDDVAARAGLTRGGVHEMALFFAERQTWGSTLQFETTLPHFEPCGGEVPDAGDAATGGRSSPTWKR